METRKRKYSRNEEDILSRFRDAQIKECRVNLVRMDIEPILAKRKPLSNEDIGKILQNTNSDDSDSTSEHIISPQSKNRLRKKENGMVFIPRSKYNEHPAKSIISPRKSKRNVKKQIIKVKMSPRTGNDRKKGLSPSRVSRNNNSIHRKNSPHAKSTPNKNYNNNSKYTNAKKSKSQMKHDIEYHLVFTPPRSVGKKKTHSNSLKALSDLINSDTLPSKLWEVERVPPLIPNVEDDSIAKELLALTEENKENLIDSNDKQNNSNASSTRDESKNKSVSESGDTKDNAIATTTDEKGSSSQNQHEEGEIVTNTQESKIVELEACTKDDLETLLSGDDACKKIESQSIASESNICKLVEEPDSNITNEDIEKTIKEVEMNAETCLGSVHEDTEDFDKPSIETDMDIKEDKKPKEDISETNDQINVEGRTVLDDMSTSIKTDEDIKDIETNVNSLENDKEKLSNDVTKETKETVEEESCEQANNKSDDECIALRRPKRIRKEKSVHFEDKNLNENPEEEKYILKSLIFRKYSENKKTYEKVVVFRSSMEYNVTINNKSVELIGAPEEMNNIEDLKILLQIVDESNLESFNVISKS